MYTLERTYNTICLQNVLEFHLQNKISRTKKRRDKENIGVRVKFIVGVFVLTLVNFLKHSLDSVGLNVLIGDFYFFLIKNCFC